MTDRARKLVVHAGFVEAQEQPVLYEPVDLSTGERAVDEMSGGAAV
jgi:hypothetical protein